MAVQVLMDEIVLWQSAGSAGSVFIQLSQITTSKMIGGREDIFTIGLPTTIRGVQPMAIDYEIGKALGAEVAIDGRVTPSIASSVERAIVRLSATLCVGLRMRSNIAGCASASYKINGNFERFGNLVRDQCTILGINAQNLEMGWSTSSRRVRAWTGTDIQAHGLRYLDEPEADELRTACGDHGSDQNFVLECVCSHVGNLIHGFGATALALVQCVYDPTELRIQAAVVNGSKITSWSSAIIAWDRGEVDGFTDSDQLFVHLSQLLHEPPEALKESDINNLKEMNILGVSIDSTTIYYRALLDAECYDDRGRMLAITSGRVSHKGVLRQLVKESARFLSPGSDVWLGFSQLPVGNFAKLTDRFVITPHYARGNVQAKMQATLAEDAFWVEFSLNDDEGKLSASIPLAKCISDMLLSPVMGRCPHSRDRRYVVDDAQRPTYLATLSAKSHSKIFGNGRDHQSSAIFYTLQNSTLEQLLQIGVLGVGNCIIQGEGCLQCAADSCRGSERPVEIIMT